MCNGLDLGDKEGRELEVRTPRGESSFGPAELHAVGDKQKEQGGTGRGCAKNSAEIEPQKESFVGEKTKKE